MLRKLKAVLISSIIWGTVWVPLGVALGVYLSRQNPVMTTDGVARNLSALSVILGATTVCYVWGAISGFLFALFVAAAERRGTLEQLSVRRFALWGAGASMALPALLLMPLPLDDTGPWPLLTVLATTGCFGAIAASGVLWLAQRGGAVSTVSSQP